MDYQEIYKINYDILNKENTNTLLNYYFSSRNSFLKGIIKDILLNEDKFDYLLEIHKINFFISSLSFEELSKLSYSKNNCVSLLSKNEILRRKNEDAIERRKNFRLL